MKDVAAGMDAGDVPAGLAEMASAYKRGATGPRELFDAFVAARVYWLAPLTPGLPVLAVEGALVAPVFSSETELHRVAGCRRWLSTDGLGLLSLLPSGVTIGLDMGSPHRLRLDPGAVRVELALVVAGDAPGPAAERRGDG